MSLLCCCGVNTAVYPHEICAPTLPERLVKMAAWIDKQPKEQIVIGIRMIEHFSLSDARPAGKYSVISAFPMYQLHEHGCVYCGNKIMYGSPLINVEIRVGKYDAYLCEECFAQKRRLCPATMSCAQACEARRSAVLQTSSLCILRCGGLPIDLRRLLYRWIRKTCVCTLH